MSHFKERSERNCLNCNAVVQGRFCHICGQENIVTKESVWHLVSHFFQDITHFDGKFFSTLRYLIFKPGFLSREYMMGRRNSYLNPIRMYVFTSAFFFLFFFKFVSKNDHGDEALPRSQRVEKLKKAIKGLRDQQAPPGDTVMQQAMVTAIGKLEKQLSMEETGAKDKEIKDSLRQQKRIREVDSALANNEIGKKKGLKVGFTGQRFTTVTAYDTVQALLPEDKQDHGLRRLFIRKGIDIGEKASGDNESFGNLLLNKFLHTLPQLFFLSLPVFTFLLWLLYKRHRQYFYANHAIFSIHLYCATFIMSFFYILIGKIIPDSATIIGGIINIAFTLTMFIYQYKCMRHFYLQRRAKTILKFIILNFVSTIVIAILALIFLTISLWQV